jgi:hypothetical protein
MRIEHEWDFPPPRRRRRFYRTIDYQPSGWSSPGVRKAVRVYWRVTLFIIKALLAIPLAIMAFGAFWLLGICIALFYSAIIHRFVA